MGFVACLFLAVALAMDCFSVSVFCGMTQKRMGRQVWAMAFLFGLFQALMPCLGWLAVNSFRDMIEAWDHWMAFLLLVFLGGRMIWPAFSGKEDEDIPVINPSSIRALLVLAVATSIDALAVGFSFPAFGITTTTEALLPLSVIGLVSALFSFAGKYVGVVIGRRVRIPAEPVGGIILVIIGVKVLFSHLCA